MELPHSETDWLAQKVKNKFRLFEIMRVSPF